MDPLVLSIYSAIYKVFGAAGAAIVFDLDNRETRTQPCMDVIGDFVLGL
jgi:hypothetical protein